jgi:hypothetical protein
MPSRSEPQQAKDRGWAASLVWAAVIVAVATAASALITPLLDRTVHWEHRGGAHTNAVRAFSVLVQEAMGLVIPKQPSDVVRWRKRLVASEGEAGAGHTS